MDSTLVVTGEDDGQRLDRFIVTRLPELSRSFVQRLIDEGHVRVGGEPRKSNYRLRSGESVSVTLPAPQAPETHGEDIPLDIIYEDEWLLVINKPAGMVVHPAVGHSSGTLVNAVLGHTRDLLVGQDERPGIVHRLDRDTSGLIVIAKQDSALRDLQQQFASRAIKKTYLALVNGQVSVPEGKIDAPLARDPRDRKRIAVVSTPRARQAITVFRQLQRLQNHTLLQVQPLTGRTHQIRVHLAYIHHPVAGDPVYSRRSAKELGLTRQFLHASHLTFTHPAKGSMMQFSAPLPADLRAALVRAGGDPNVLDNLPS